jgi:hypothetical protein
MTHFLLGAILFAVVICCPVLRRGVAWAIIFVVLLVLLGSGQH